MRLKQLLLLMLLCMACLLGSAQQRYSARFSETPLKQVLPQLEQFFLIEFAYSSDQVNLSTSITLTLEQTNLEQTLKAVFRQTGIAYTITGNMVTLYPDPSYRVTISGTIRELGTGELLIGVIAGTMPASSGAVSDAYGVYTLSIPPGTYEFQFNYIGFMPYKQTVTVNRSQTLNIELQPATQLSEVVVNADAGKQKQLNIISIPLKEIQAVPMILGEKDVVKYAMLSPGIQKGNEGNSYMYVRGGGPDQNLVLIDDAIIYNAYHFLGLASLFSGSELRYAELIKGGFSSRYGGRLSSVLNMSMKDGNRERIGFDATIGTISSRLMVEGPIVPGKSSFLISGRKSYIDKVSSWVAKDESAVLDYGFYDVHAKISTDIGHNNRLMISGYIGNDAMNTGSDPSLSAYDDGISWGNHALSMRWSHRFNAQWHLNTSLSNSHYGTRSAFAQQDSKQEWYTSAVESTIDDYTAKTEVEYNQGNGLLIRSGAGYTLHQFKPRTSVGYNDIDSGLTNRQDFKANEAFGYAELDYRFNPKYRLISGVRMSYYKNSTSYVRAEPRINFEYRPKSTWLINTSYAMMNQYMHLISGFGGFGFPNDLWVSSDENLAPQRSQLITLGATRSALVDGTISITVEGYTKWIENAVSMRENTSFFQVLPVNGIQQVDKWSELATQGKGSSYGVECMVKRSANHLSGWVSYTLSKTTQQFAELNNGEPFAATYDRRHDIGIYISYQTAKHWQFSTNWLYGTGNAISLPVGEYYATSVDPSGMGTPNTPMIDYEHKNNFRMKPYHRLDISVQYKHRLGKQLNGTIEFSVYNVYNRANPYFYQIETTYNGNGTAVRKLQQMSLFPIMPSISWTVIL